MLIDKNLIIRIHSGLSHAEEAMKNLEYQSNGLKFDRVTELNGHELEMMLIPQQLETTASDYVLTIGISDEYTINFLAEDRCGNRKLIG